MTDPAAFLFPFLERSVVEFKNIVEFVALQSGRKGVVRLVLPPAEAALFCSNFEASFPDMTVRKSPFGLKTVFSASRFDHFQQRVTCSNNEELERAYYFGVADRVDAARAAEAQNADSRELGTIYGYPDCCARSYEKIGAHSGVWTQAYFAIGGQLIRRPAVTNRLSSLTEPYVGFHFDYFPCSPLCHATEQICLQNRADLLQSDFCDFVSPTEFHSRALVLCHDGTIISFQLEEDPTDGHHRLTRDRTQLLYVDPKGGQPDFDSIEIEITGDEIYLTRDGTRDCLSQTPFGIWAFQ